MPVRHPTANNIDESRYKATFRLRPKQKLFVENDATFSFYVGGLGAGKTFAGAVRAIKFIVDHPGSLGLIGAPTFAMLRDTTQRTFLDLLPAGLIANINKNEQSMTFINGCVVLFRSMDDPDRCRGLNLSWFWLDEAPICGHYAWKVLKARAGRQDKHKYPRAGWATGTPRGKDGFYDEFELNPTADHLLVRASTYENAVNLPDGYADSLGYTGAFRLQEIEGRFEAFEGLVYQINAEQGTPDSHILPARQAYQLPSGAIAVYSPSEDQRGWQKLNDAQWLKFSMQQEAQGLPWKRVQLTRSLGGVDWGFNNPAAAVMMGIDHDNRCYQLCEIYKRQMSLQKEYLPKLVEMARFFEISDYYCDSAEPTNVVDLRHALAESPAEEGGPVNCAVHFADKSSITAGIQTVRSFLQKRDDGTYGLMLHSSCENTRREYGVYQYPTNENEKRNSNELPIAKNDHALDATRYLLHTCFGAQRGGEIAHAGSNTEGKHDTLEQAEERLKAEQEAFIVMRGQQASQFLRNLDSFGIPREGLFRTI